MSTSNDETAALLNNDLNANENKLSNSDSNKIDIFNAVLSGNLEALNECIQSGVDVNAKNQEILIGHKRSDLYTALHYIVFFEHDNIESAKTDPNVEYKLALL